VPASYYDTEASGFTDKSPSSGHAAQQVHARVHQRHATWFKSMAGQHTFKVGLRHERFANDVHRQHDAERHALLGQQHEGQKGPHGYYELTKSATVGDVHSDNYFGLGAGQLVDQQQADDQRRCRAENEFIPSYKQGAGLQRVLRTTRTARSASAFDAG
jgi:hypothetical protein